MAIGPVAGAEQVSVKGVHVDGRGVVSLAVYQGRIAPADEGGERLPCLDVSLETSPPPARSLLPSRAGSGGYRVRAGKDSGVFTLTAERSLQWHCIYRIALWEGLTRRRTPPVFRRVAGNTPTARRLRLIHPQGAGVVMIARIQCGGREGFRWCSR